MTCFRSIVASAALLLMPAIASSQTQPAPANPVPNNDVRVDPLQPDFTLAALPTTLRMPANKWAFRVTHRFTRPLGQGDFGDLASDFFGFDSGAQIGLELRYGLAPGTQIGIHRTSDRTIQLFGQHNFLSERNGSDIGLDAIATFEGANNLRQHHQGAFGMIVSKNAWRRAALYAEPIWIANTNPFADQGSDNHTLMLGLGTRVRIRPSTYLIGEISPRLTGYDPGVSQYTIGLESRAGGHSFQLNFSNGFGTTLGQVATSGFNNDDWYIGFNISRKFF